MKDFDDICDLLMFVSGGISIYFLNTAEVVKVFVLVAQAESLTIVCSVVFITEASSIAAKTYVLVPCGDDKLGHSRPGIILLK